MKICKKCLIEKPLTNFKKFTHNKTKRAHICKRCSNNLSPQKYNYKKPKLTEELIKTNRQNSYYKNKYGLTLEQYNSLLKKQNHVCAICNLPETSKHTNGTLKNLAVDHCHTTKEIRGLLCDNCNRGLGYFKDNAKSLKTAIEYLKTKKMSQP